MPFFAKTPPPRTAYQINGPIDISPTITATETMDSYYGSPDPYGSPITPSSSPPPVPQKVTIEHKVKSRGGGRSLILGMSKPVLGMVAATVFATSGGMAYFAKEWFRIPGLLSQIDELTTEVGRLESQVNRLSNEVDILGEENDRYAALNDDLNRTAKEYSRLNGELNSTTTRLQNVTLQLNLSNTALERMVTNLSQQNQFYSNLNEALNDTNSELSQLNYELSTVASFLNETSKGIQHTFEALTSYLADQIEINRGILLDMVRNTYSNRISTWECDFRAYFRGEPFINDGNVPIYHSNHENDNPIEGNDDANNMGVLSSNYEQVMDYVDNRVLSVLCLDRTDFELFMNYLSSIRKSGGAAEGITSNQLARAITIYTTRALEYYFEEEAGNGVTSLDWAEASYSCEYLNMPYRWDSNLLN